MYRVSQSLLSEGTLCPRLAYLLAIYNIIMSHTVEPLLDDESIFIIAYQHTHTLPRTNCSSKKQAIMIDNVPVGWKLANSLLASQFSDNHWLSPSP